MLCRNTDDRGLIAEHVEEIHKSPVHGFLVSWPSYAACEACAESSSLIGSLLCISESATVSSADESSIIGVRDLTFFSFALVLDDILSSDWLVNISL
jgi:hypothetical protein